MTLRILYFGTYDKNYLHNRIMIEGLRSAGVEVTECHVPLWEDTADKVATAGGQIGMFRLVIRLLRAYAALWRAYWPFRQQYDVMVLGYTGQFDVFLGRVLTWWSGRPLVLDVLMSLYLIACERGLARRNWLRRIEYVAYRLPDMLILDTPEYAEWFEQTYGVARTRFHLVPLGANNHIFQPAPPRCPDGAFRVLYYGTFIPLHGVEHIIQAAALLRERHDIHFELIGQGPMRSQAESLTAQLGLKQQVAFSDWVEIEKLPARVAQADVLLGVFGVTEQAKRTIPNKIYQGLAMARPVITGNSPAARAALKHGQQAYLVEAGDPRALADAILTLQADPQLRLHLAEAGQRLFQERFTVEAIGRQTLAHLRALPLRNRPGRAA